MIVLLVIYILIVVSKNLNFTLAMISLFGMASVGRTNIGYIYLMELIPKKYKIHSGTFL
jgi:hypothetical protein